MSSVDSFNSLRSQNETLLRQLKEKQVKIHQQLNAFKKNIKGNGLSTASNPAKKPEKVKKPKKSSEKKHVTYDLGEKSPEKPPKKVKKSPKTQKIPQNEEKKMSFDESFLHVYTPKMSDKDKYLRQVESARRKKLNFSYNSNHSPKKFEFDLNVHEIDQEIEQISALLNSSQFKNDKSEKLKQMVEYEDYLLSTGNNRINSSSPTSHIRAKSAYMTALVTPKKLHRKDPCTPTEKKMNRSSSLRLERSGSRDNKENSHFLGYDWIAGNVENQNLTFTQKNESFWEDLNHFRRAHSEECVATAATARPMLSNVTAALNYNDLLQPAPTTRVPSPVHTCVHCYTLNDRLFAEPLCSDPNGKSLCPVCYAPKSKSSVRSPCFVQVTVPRKVLEDEDSPIVGPSRQPVASVSLRDHCAPGQECSRPASLPTAKDISLKNMAGRKENRILRPDEIEKYILKSSAHLKDKHVEPRTKLTAKFLRSMNRK